MLFKEPLEFTKIFLSKINQSIAAETPSRKLSAHQAWWVAFCTTAIILTNSVCWTRFERMSLGTLTSSAISWMFRKAKIPWERLLKHSIQVLLQAYGITEGLLVIDDSDRHRSKNTTQISAVHKIKDKKTGGYLMGQNIVSLILVSKKITIPLGFAFYKPDPVWKKWQQENQRLKKMGVKKMHRPKAPAKNPDYPTKQELALQLLRAFSNDFPAIKVNAILADALYGTHDYLSQAQNLFGGTQVISQLRSTQLITSRGREQSLQEYFSSYASVPMTLTIRGGTEKVVVMGGARLLVTRHKAKRFVIALRYEGETEYRYIVATDLCWRMTDIAAAYTMRWLVEVFFSDWKSYEGWCQMAKQPGVEGSCRGVILSLLTDHALLFHPDQTALLKHNLPAATVGSLREQIRFDAITRFMHQLLSSENPQSELEHCIDKIKNIVSLMPSTKHMNGRELGRLGPSSSLKYKMAA